MRKTKPQIRSNQKGVVTIVVVILIMLLMSLIVLAMSRNANREQRQALDRQLNSQAFYAAESGINDLVHRINDLPEEQKDCNNALARSISDDGSIRVTCVLYDKTPNSLFYEVPLGDADVVPIQTAEGTNSLKISFEGKDISNARYSGCNAFDGGSKFPPRSQSLNSNCTAGVLRIDIISSENPSRSNLLEKTVTLFIVPKRNGAGSFSYPSSPGFNDQGRIATADCNSGNSPRDCNITITNLNLAVNQTIYLSIRSIYRPNTLELGTPSGNVSFLNAQAVVDSTGKANDVLKRIKAAISINDLSTANPSFSIQSATDVCKLLEVTPDSTKDTGCNLND